MSEQRWRHKALEWCTRYLPGEIIGTAAELGGVALVYLATGSLVAAAVAATISATVGYYATNYVRAVRAYRAQGVGILAANGWSLRSILIEFGPGEIVDSVIIRPLAYYLLPLLLAGSASSGSAGWTVLGWVVGKLLSDSIFYACAIVSYELNRSRVVRYDATPEGHPHGLTVSPAAGEDAGR